MDDKKTGYHGNQNAVRAPGVNRTPITIRLPETMIAALRANGNVTQQIENAIQKLLSM